MMLTRFCTFTTLMFGSVPGCEENPDRGLTGTGGVGDHVTHVLDAVDGLLQRNQDRVDQHVGTGTGISNGDLNRRRRDVGELGCR